MAYAMPRTAAGARPAGGGAFVDPAFIPDNLRCGSTLYYLTWARVTVFSFALMFFVAVVSTVASLLPHAPIVGVASSEPSFLDNNAPIASRSARSTASTKKPVGAPVSFCSARSSSPDGHLTNWRMVALGSSPHYPVGESGRRCEWKDKTDTQVPFKVCTFPTSQDSQISTWIHKDGRWQNWKTEKFEQALPILEPVSTETGKPLTISDLPEAEQQEADEGDQLVVDMAGKLRLDSPGARGRTMVVDIGTNLGFFTLLAAKRGYDVVSMDPSDEVLLRLLYSLDENGIRVARSGSEIGLDGPSGDREAPNSSLSRKKRRQHRKVGGSRPEPAPRKGLAAFASGRQPIVYLFENAAADHYSYGSWTKASASTEEKSRYSLQFIRDNPGASSIVNSDRDSKDSVATVVLNDLVAETAPIDSNAPSSFSSSNKVPSRLKGAVEAATGRGNSKNPALKGKPAGSAASTATAATKVPLELAPRLDPAKVRLIKISAEGWDSRVLNGLSKFLAGSPDGSGVPFVLLVFNRDHIKNLGCDPNSLVRTLFDQGYALYFASIFIYREQELVKFLKGMGAGGDGPARSMELLFVRREMAEGF